MRFAISKDLTQKLPDLLTGFVILEDLQPKKDAPETISRELAKIQEFLLGKYSSSEEITSIIAIKQFENAFDVFGLNKFGVKVSISNMLDAVCLKSKSLIFNNPVIDLYNLFVLTHFVPAGAYDLDRIVGDVVVRPSLKGDRFKQLGKDKYEELEDDTIVFADADEILCNHWVYKQSESQKIHMKTKNVLLRFEGLGLDEKQLKNLLEEFKDLVKHYFKFGAFQSIILGKDRAEGEIKLSKDLEARRSRYADSKELLQRGVSNVIVYNDLLDDIVDGKKLRIKHGVDPTTKDLHLGYAVIYEKLRQFQIRGHKIVFLIGSFTARFGDPTDKNEARTMKAKADVMKIAKTYVKQLSRILDIRKVEVRFNGSWFDKMSAEDLLCLMSEFTVARMLERDMFKKRIEDAREIGLHEIVYPVLQGYDSVELESDLTIIGTDQTFNELQARPLQERRGQKPQNIIAMDLLPGTDGKRKMSQSYGNYVGFDDAPEDKFGKIMSIPDELIYRYFEVCTRVTYDELQEVKSQLDAGINPRDLKLKLAEHIVAIYDGEKASASAREHFLQVFQKKEMPDEIAEFRLKGADFDVLSVLMEAGVILSKGEGRRLIEQGAVKVDNEKIPDINFRFEKNKEYIVQVGKRKFLRIK